MRCGWDASSYHRVSAVMDGMADEVLGRLPLRGDETVLDAGCGTGRVTRRLLDRLPRGRVIAVDADPEMAALARSTLPAGTTVIGSDLLDLTLSAPADAVFSTATFHWVLDHERLFARLAAALRPGGRPVAQCGGSGNYLETVPLGSWVRRLPASSRRSIVSAVWSRVCSSTVDYVRLNIVGRRDAVQ